MRRGEPEGVHDLRVAMRRIRSALATFRPLVDVAVTEPVRAELRWAADELGRARDSEIIVERVTRWIDAHEALVAGAAAERHVLGAVTESRRAAHVHVGDVVETERFAAAVDAVDRVVDQPPLTRRARRPADAVAEAFVHRESKRLWRKVARAQAAVDPEARAPLWHEVRKAAKRLRYAAEAGMPYDGAGLEAIADAAAEVQTALGAHHDSVVTSAALRAIATAHADAAVALCTGQMVELEAVESVQLEVEAAEALARLERLTQA